ncbi:MAG: NAD-dependent epimerase/dehydratase family protein [Conexivisphaerales archaeon]
MKVLVTGGSGFIGRNIVAGLKARGHEVVSLDLSDKGSDLHVKGSVLDLELLIKSLKGVDTAFHLAAVTSPPEFENLKGNGFMTNVMGTYNVLAASSLQGVRRVVLASSSSVYGSIGRQAREEDMPEGYSNFYPLSKVVNEMTARTYLNYNVETVSLRYFNTYGFGENTKGSYSSVIWKFIDDIANNRRPVIYGDGTQSRDFIYVEDAAAASILAMERGRAGESYNVGTGTSTSFNRIFEIIREETGYAGSPAYVQNPLRSYQIFTQADISKSRKELGFEPRYDIRAGVRKILEQLKLNS